MNLFHYFRAEIVGIVAALADSGVVPGGLDTGRIAVEPPRDAAHGDVSTNAAMVLAKTAGMVPRALAEHIAGALRGLDSVTEVTIAGPGFVNWRLAPDFWHARLR